MKKEIEKNKSENFPLCTDVSSERFGKNPDDCLDQINIYGTYEIQPTADTENLFPTIAQGLAKKAGNSDIRQSELPD